MKNFKILLLLTIWSWTLNMGSSQAQPTGNMLWAKTTGGKIRSVKSIADINNDGRPDVLAGAEDHVVYCFEGDSQMNGYLLWSYIAGGPIWSVAVIGDVNGDTKPDALVGSGDNTVYCIEGDSDGTGNLLWSYQTSGDVWSVAAIEDVNSDGTPDVLAGSGDNHIYCIEGDSEGTGNLLWKYSTGSDVRSVAAIEDINGDGRPDVIAGSSDDKVYCIGGAGNLLWSYTTGGDVWSVAAIGDVSNDGKPDVLAGAGDATISCIQSNSHLAGKRLWSYQTGGVVWSVEAIEDVNGDWKPDVLAGSGDKAIYCIDGDSKGEGKLLWSYLTDGDVWTVAALGDVSGNRKPDVLAGSTDNTVYCLEGGGFGAGNLIWSYSYQIYGSIRTVAALGDVNVDGKPEAIVGAEDDNLYCIEGDSGNLIWAYRTDGYQTTIHYRSPSVAALRDVNGDGRPEALATSAGNAVYCIEGDSENSGNLLWTFRPHAITWCVAPIEDVSGDRQPDALAGAADNTIYCIKGSSNRMGDLLWSYSIGGDVWDIEALSDVNGDGFPEVLAGAADNTVYCLQGNSHGIGNLLWSYPVNGDVWSVAEIGDINGDRRPEVLAGAADNMIYCIGGTGNLLWSYPIGGDVWSVAEIGDISGDGKPDILAGAADNRVYCFDGSGNLLWSYPTYGDIWSVASIEDVNDDEWPDALAGTGDDYVYCLDGRNGTLLWSYSTDYDVWRVIACDDMNGDGIQDVLAGTADNVVYCIEGDSYGTGSLLWTYVTDGDVWDVSCLKDVNANGVPEALAGCNGIFYCVESPTIGDIHVSAASHDYGTVLVGSPSPWVLTLSNDGTAELIVSSIASHHPDFTVTSPTFPRTVLPGENVDVTVVFTPSSGGVKSDTLTIISNDPDEPTTHVYVSGTGAAPDIEVTPNVLEETVAEGSTSTVVLTIANQGEFELTFQITESVNWLAITPATGTVPSHGNSDIHLFFDATSLETGSYSTDITVESNDPADPVTTIPVNMLVKAAWVMVHIHPTVALPGDTAHVPIDLDNQTLLSAPIDSVLLLIGFDDTLLTLIDVTPTERTAHMSNFGWTQSLPHQMVIAISDISGNVISSGTGSIADLSLLIQETAIFGKSTMLQFLAVILTDSLGDPVPFETQDGALSIGLKGDVNQDGKINVFDVMIGVNIIIGLHSPTPYELWAADCLIDDVINIIDLVCILRIILDNP